MSDDTPPPNPPNQRPISPTSPDPVVLATDSCIGLLRTTKLTADHLTEVRNAVAEDLRYLHTRITDVSDVVSDRFEKAEKRLTTLESKFNGLSGASTQLLADTDLLTTPLTSPTGISQVSDPLATPLAALITTRRVNIPPPLNLDNDSTPPLVEPLASGNGTPRPDDLDSQQPLATSVRPNSIRKSESFYVNVMSMKMPLNIPTFSGASHENFATFLRSFVDHANAANALTPEGKLSVFLTYLTDFARDKAQELMDTKQETSFDDVVAYLRSTFQDPTRAETERQQLRQCTQRPDESVDAFSTRVRKLAQSAYVDKNREYIADKAKEAFVDGLAFNLKFHVKGESPATFQEAQNSAIKFEFLLAEAAKANTIAPQALTVVPDIEEFAHQPTQPHFSEKNVICYHCGVEGHYANECWYRQNQHRYEDNFREPGSQSQHFESHRHFLANEPAHRHQFTSDQPQYNNRYVNSLAPVQNPLVEQLRSELQAQQARMDALVKRNSELAAAATSAPAYWRTNVLVAVPRLDSREPLFRPSSPL